MVAFWKVKREFLRVWFKVVDSFAYPIEKLVQNRYDRKFSKLTKLTAGQVLPQEKIAIFFIFQPEGVAKSVLLTCSYLKNQGFAVLLVSSTKINKSSREDLLKNCWKILERPNYGYDFGGYRDGLRVLSEANVSPHRLIILNDSIWFPIVEGTSLINNLEEEGLAFNSPVYINNPERSRNRRHFQSFFFLLRKEALESASFIKYWKSYHVSSKKRVVLQLGEKGFSLAMFRGGFGGDARATKVVLFDLLREQTDEFLYKTLCYAAYDSETLLHDAKILLASYNRSAAWRQDVLKHMKHALSICSPIGVFVYASTMLLDFSFLKKRSFATVFDGMRWQYLRAVRNGDLPAPHPDILAEIEASKMDGGLTTDPSIPVHVSATKAA